MIPAPNNIVRTANASFLLDAWFISLLNKNSWASSCFGWTGDRQFGIDNKHEKHIPRRDQCK